MKQQDEKRGDGRVALYAGSFDPISLGHIDLVQRGAAIFERLVVGIAAEPAKTPLFSAEERRAMASESLGHLRNVEVEIFSGLLVEHLKRRGIRVILRGIRTVTDFEYEFQMAIANKRLAPQIETFFMMTEEIYSYLSSSMIKEIARLGGEISSMVPPAVEERVKAKMRRADV
jgi:pantetheine-phosphate adenylyltransferase